MEKRVIPQGIIQKVYICTVQEMRGGSYFIVTLYRPLSSIVCLPSRERPRERKDVTARDISERRMTCKIK